MHFLASILIFMAGAVSGFFGLHSKQALVGAALPSATAVFETSLAAPITSSATSMTLAANSVRGGGSLSGFACFTVDEGSAQAETICGTVSATTVSSLTRGVSQATGTTTVAALQFSHRRGANVKITDFPILQIVKAQNNGEDTFPNALTFDGIAKYSSALTFTTQSNQLASVKYSEDYANNVIAGGAATSTESLGGKSELATLAEQAASTDLGASKPLVLQAKYSTSTCQVVGGYNVTASTTTGKLDKNCIDLSLNYPFTGSDTFVAATSTNFGITNGLNWGAGGTSATFFTQKSASRQATSTVLTEDGTGGLSFNIPRVHALAVTDAEQTTSNTATTTLKTVVIPANTFDSATALRVNLLGYKLTGTQCGFDISIGSGAATSSLGYIASAYASLTGMITATTTNRQSSVLWGYGTNANVGPSQAGGPSTQAYAAFTNFTSTAQMYLSFNAAAITAGTCGIVGATVEQIKNI